MHYWVRMISEMVVGKANNSKGYTISEIWLYIFFSISPLTIYIYFYFGGTEFMVPDKIT